MNKGLIIYIGPLSFPDGGAGARRVLGNSLSLLAGGYDVYVGSGQMPAQNNPDPLEFQGIKVFSIGERTAENKPVLIKHLLYSVMGRKTIRWMESLSQKPRAVVLYGGDIPYLFNLIPWCKKRNIPIIFEACEWYDPINMPGGRFSPYRLNFEITMRYFVPKIKNVLVISSFLEKYYNNLGCQTVVIPPTIDTVTFSNVVKNQENIVSVGYTGTPGNKDIFNTCLEAFLETDPNGEKFRFKIAGLTKEEILQYASMRKRNLKDLPGVIDTIGKVSHSEAIKLISECDFSVLLRYPKKYAQAGFPTKVVESMAMGTPVICNLTSDLKNYIHDGYSGIVCKDHNKESLIEALSRVQSMSSREKSELSFNARKMAETSFDYRLYVNKLEDFINRIELL
jgi:glycosyltransferase involved in cell wall biosynthesis